MTQFTPEDLGKLYTDAEIMAHREAAIEEVRKYAENVAEDLAQALKTLALAESFIPLTKRYAYELLKSPPSYGGSE